MKNIPFLLRLCPAGLGCEEDVKWSSVIILFANLFGFPYTPVDNWTIVPKERGGKIYHVEPRGIVEYSWHEVTILYHKIQGRSYVFDPTTRERLFLPNDYLQRAYENSDEIKIRERS
jgi:hypothetical protein